LPAALSAADDLDHEKGDAIMSDLQKPLEALVNRRRFLKSAGATALGLAGAGLLAKGADAAPLPGGLDAAVLNFALNLEYLEAEYYSHAVSGQSLDAIGIPVNGSDGTPAGPVVVKANSRVPFALPNIQAYAMEIAVDEESHVRFIQQALTKLGVPYIARPKIDLLNSFNALAQAAGLGTSFDPFANDVNFLLGAYIFEDVGVTAYHGGAPLLSNKTVLNYAAGILAVEAYHAGLIRTKLFDMNQGDATQRISNVRIMLGGQSRDSNGQLADPDAGVATVIKPGTTSTIALSDINALAFSRTTRQVLNIVYGNPNGAPGGFLPNGANGFIR